ncbi:MAG TPA: hypothetical protein VHB02_17325 [Acidimicrobiales bacterium]|nr:hypothetical protein [Acidimicrobiales bacterium]
MTVPGCPGILDPVCQVVGGAGSTVVGIGTGAVFGDLAGWVAGGAGWLLDQVGAAMSASTSIDLTAGWFTAHYRVMVGIAAAVALPVLLAAVVQATYRQNAAVLVRTALVQLPLAFLLTAVAVQMVQLSLAVTDALCAAVSSGAGGGVQQELAGLATALLAGGTPELPSFVLFIAGILLVVGALALWFELLARTAAVYVAVLFLPLALASMAWPAISHWARRLADTLAALVLSKFVIVVVLSLAVSALGSGQSGLSSVFAGAALLFLAVFAPFVLLRIVPAVEAGAVHQLEGLRRRMVPSGPVPQSAARFALRQVAAASVADPVPGTGAAPAFGAPAFGAPGSPGGSSGADRGSGAGGRTGADRGHGPGARGAGTGGSPRPVAGRSPGGSPGGDHVPRSRSGPEPAGPGGLPMWQAGPSPDELLSEDLGRSTVSPDGAPRSGRGPMPLWGGPPAAGAGGEGGGGGGGEGEGRSGAAGSGTGGTRFAARGSVALARDRMGPVIRWVPPAGYGGVDRDGSADGNGSTDGNNSAVEGGGGGGR